MNKIKVELIYTTPTQQHFQVLEVNAGSTIESVILQSGVLTLFPEIDLNQQKVGIFSKLKALSDEVKAGDRIEIYRPLLIDPKEARRAKARRAVEKRKS